MSYEIVKSIDIKKGKVYTRQCSNNVTPKHFFKNEHYGLTKIFQKKGRNGVIKQVLKWALDGSYKFEPSNNLARVIKQTVDQARELEEYNDLIYEKYKVEGMLNCEDDDDEIEDAKKIKKIEKEIEELAWWQYCEITNRPKPIKQNEATIHVEKVSVGNGNGACSNCDRGEIKESGMGLVYPYEYTYHITIGRFVFRLCEDCKKRLRNALIN